MRSLFLKIFLWYLAATTVVFGGTFLLMVRTGGHGPAKRMFSRLLAGHAQEAVTAWENQGAEGLRAYLQQLERDVELKAHLFDGSGRELLGDTVPREMQDGVRGAIAANGRSADEPARLPMLSAIVVGASGGRYAFVMGPPVRPPWSGTPLLALGLTAVVVSFWLARNVTAPVRRLRAATLRLAGGELQARVGGRLGRRRDVLGDLARDFDIMAERLESLVGAQRRLLRDVSHELRSPLARLHVALGLAGRCATPDAAEALARIEYEAHVINALIDDLLVLVRLEAGDPGRGDELVDLVDVVQQVADDANFEAGARNRSVRVLGEDTCNVRGTRSLLHRAIENVVRNAIRYTADGTTVDISLATEAAADGAWARVSVRDRGPGVPEETLPELFRAFYRVGNARDRQSGGVGLGLAIAERATRLHGGDIRAANAEDGGLLVEFRLPM